MGLAVGKPVGSLHHCHVKKSFSACILFFFFYKIELVSGPDTVLKLSHSSICNGGFPLPLPPIVKGLLACARVHSFVLGNLNCRESETVVGMVRKGFR